jgi:FkbM family methyltransferase
MRKSWPYYTIAIRALIFVLLFCPLYFFFSLDMGRSVSHGSPSGQRLTRAVRQRLATGQLVVTSHAAYCDFAVFDPTPELEGTFARVLFEGSPRYWMVPPTEFSFLAKEGLLDGGTIVTSFLKQYGPFQDYFRDSPPDALMVDVGSNVGLASMPVAAMGRKVIAFEPVPSNQRAFMLSVCVNGFADRVTLVRAAVGGASGTADIYVPRGRADNTAIGKGASTANVGGSADALRVPVVTLDTFLRPEDIKRIWLIKIDVQGYELRVLEGARAVLGALPPSTWVVAEHDPKLMAASGVEDTTADIAFMASLGFSVHLAWKGDVVPQSRWATVPLEEYGRDMWYNKQ